MRAPSHTSLSLHLFLLASGQDCGVQVRGTCLLRCAAPSHCQAFAEPSCCLKSLQTPPHCLRSLKATPNGLKSLEAPSLLSEDPETPLHFLRSLQAPPQFLRSLQAFPYGLRSRTPSPLRTLQTPPHCLRSLLQPPLCLRSPQWLDRDRLCMHARVRVLLCLCTPLSLSWREGVRCLS